ncbi:MAG: CAP domain-containing protein, partial [Pseudolabrys sp.]
PAVTSTIVPTDTAPIEAPPLPRPKPSVTGDNPAALISAFRRQHGEGSVTIDGALTRIAQEQANAMAVRDSLDHNALAPFSSRMSRSRFNRAAENIAYGHADFASTLKQWTNSAGHRANLLLHGAKWIGVAHAQSGRRMYWAMVIGGEMKDHAVYSNIRR